MPILFFSYSRTDSAFALKLAKDLRSAGANLWIDQLDIPAGERWDTTVQNALTSAECLLVVLSPTSVTSQNVMDEVAFALASQKKIIPVLYKNCEIPFRLQRLQYVDFTKSYLEGLAQIRIATSSVEPLEPTKLKPNNRVISLRATISRYPTRSMYIGIALLGALLGLTTVYWMLGPDHIQKVLYVQATFLGWQASGIEVKRGQTLGIRASGTIVYWRDSRIIAARALTEIQKILVLT